VLRSNNICSMNLSIFVSSKARTSKGKMKV